MEQDKYNKQNPKTKIMELHCFILTFAKTASRSLEGIGWCGWLGVAHPKYQVTHEPAHESVATTKHLETFRNSLCISHIQA